MDSTDKDLEKASDKQKVIGKMHNMQWLKCSSPGHTKLQDRKEVTTNSLKSKINEGASKEVDSIDTVSSTSELNKIDLVVNKSLNEESSVSKGTSESCLNIDSPVTSMETAWSEDVSISSTTFKNSQSLQRLDKEIDAPLTENIVQLEPLRLNEKDKTAPELHNGGDSRWDNHNMSNLPKSDSDITNQVSSKQCHDNNNNNAKSKTQSALETKKDVQMPTKLSTTKRLSDPKIRRQLTGTSLKESCTSLKHVSKSKDETSNICNESTSPVSTDSKKPSVGTTSKILDKSSKVNGYNKNLASARMPRTKEQQFFRHSFPTSTFNDRSRTSLEAFDDKNKTVSKLKTTKSEPVDETKRCHKVQITRTQSYNIQYNRNKPLVRPQQRYSKGVMKEDEVDSYNNNNSATEKKKCESQQSLGSKQVSDFQPNSGKNLSVSEYNTAKPNTVSVKRTYQNSSNTRNVTERSFKDDQSYTQKFKKDANVYRRSLGTSYKETDEQKKTADSMTKDYKNRVNSTDSKLRSQPESSKNNNGASNTNKTDELEPSVDVQSAKPSKETAQESQASRQNSCDETQVQLAKTEPEDTSNNHSNNKTNETKSVKFSDNVQEFVTHSSTYSDNNSHQISNKFYPDAQPVSNNAQQMENRQNKIYFDNSNAQYNSNTFQSTEKDLHLPDLRQKTEQNPHVSSPQIQLPPNNSAIVASMHCQMPQMYQYNNSQAVIQKTDNTIFSQNNVPAPSTSSYSVDTQNMIQSDPNLMHNTQPSVIPPPGFHNHSMTQQNQWNGFPDMFVFGNMMNHPMSMVQASRHACNGDYSNLQQNFVQPQLFYVPPMCMQTWNTLMQYPTAPLFQNYANCNAFPAQVLSDSMNCPSMQNHPYKHFQQIQSMENAPSFSAPVKLDNYMQACKNRSMKDNVDMRASQYRQVPNEYQNCTQEIPLSYGIAVDSSVARNNGSSNVHVKYAPHATANYSRTSEMFHGGQENRKDDSRDTDCVPPMVSPKEIMYYGVNYSRKMDNSQNSRSEGKHYQQHYVPHYQKNTNYHHASPREYSPRVNVGGSRKVEH